MIPELGHFALIIALVLATAQVVIAFTGARTGSPALLATVRPAAVGQFVFVAGAFAALAWCFVTSDFSVLNVASHSNSKLPVQYRFAATWGSHEGSILLWALMLATWTFAVAVVSRALPERFIARVLGVMGLVSVGFLLFILITSNPFERLVPAALEGQDLNPLLQDPGMVIHPPMLYMGYVGFSVAFAFSIAALLEGRLDATWARWSRPWTLAAWCFLTVGICLGSAWAYYTLGWGGWWFWDPVENASFMPWLVGTALIHSLAVTEKRGTFRSWTVLLAIVAFSLSLVGTFLVRSGVLTSVHAFATDPRRGVFILLFLVLVVGSSFALFAWRAPRVGLGSGFGAVSRESMLLANNVLLAVAMSAVLLGTLYPLFLDALGMGKISVGPPYFDAVFVPLMAPAVFLMALGPMASWKRATLPDLWIRLRWAMGVSVAAALILPFAMGKTSLMIAFGLWLAFWVVAATFAQVIQRLRGSAQSTLRGKIAAQSRSWYGMTLAHLGIGIFILGVTAVKGYETERDLRMSPGDRVTLGGWQFEFKGTKQIPGPNYSSVQGEFEVSRDGKPVRVLYPEKRTYPVSGQTMTWAAIDTGITRDIYVSLGEPVGDGAWGVRVYHKPFIDWIWAGCFVMALGGLLALSDRRYRLRRQVAEIDAAAAAGARVREAPMKRLAFVIPLGVFIALAIFLAVGLTRDPREVPSPLVGKPAPAFRLARLQESSQAFGPEQMRGKVWMLNVWASWCVACRAEHPVLVEFSKGNGVPIVGLNWKDTREDGLKWLERFGNPYALSAFDGDGRVGIDYGVYGAPETFVIDREGVIRYKQIGPITREALDEKILPLLKGLGA